MLNNETIWRTFVHCVKVVFFMARLLSEFYGTTKGSISAAAVSHNVIGRPAKKEEEKGILLSSSSFSFFIISYKIFLEQRSDNNFFLCAPAQKKEMRV